MTSRTVGWASALPGGSSLGRAALVLVSLAGALGAAGCSRDGGTLSAERAKTLAASVARAAEADVEEVRKGLPEGAKRLEPLFEKADPDAATAREGLETARAKVQDLRVAKSTFFAVVGRDGVVLRNDRDQDSMAGKPVFQAFPGLRAALEGRYVEARGDLPEAAGVKGRGDGQWVAGAPIRAGGEVRALYVTGWSWSSYAYRLENHARSLVRGEQKEPLVYVYVVVGDQAFGAPVSPDVNAKAILALDPLGKAAADGAFSSPLTIEGRDFGLATQTVPALGEKVAVAVLRSET